MGRFCLGNDVSYRPNYIRVRRRVTNDVGFITMPDGRRSAGAVFARGGEGIASR